MQWSQIALPDSSLALARVSSRGLVAKTHKATAPFAYLVIFV